MQARTKKHLTETVALQFVGPIVNMMKAIENLKKLGFVDTSEFTHWREAFPEYQDHDLPQVCLRASRAKENLTQKQLAELLGFRSGIFLKWKMGSVPLAKKWQNALGRF